MSVGAILTLGFGSFGSVNLLPTLGYLSSSTPAPTTTLRGRRRKVPLYNVTFDGAQVAVESAAELKELARLSDSIPKVALMPSVDYGKKISALRRAIVDIEAERVKQIDLEDDEAFILMFH